MSYHESRSIVSLISSLLGGGLYAFYVIQRSAEPGYDPTTIISFWGTITLIAIAVTIGTNIILSILVTIVVAVAERDEEPDLVDERDRLFELKGNQVSFGVFGGGFVIAMILLAVGLPPLAMFHLIVFSLFGASMAASVTQLYHYRRGY